ncbi:ABC transporter transmembrane region [Aspergillus sclerotialis]|uniref:ABC transporter transmembrane region n=1 Tax=Aspergillus sclerotialis TaxID=2070753 RepID=A0A3A2ZVP7_9EURO|nr:ABC transporter transmembrane region [Aspergillus sclerotialis]
MSICIPFCIIAVYILQKFYLRTSRQLRFLDLESRSPLYAQFLETVEGLATIRAFGWQQLFQETNTKLLDTSQRPFYFMYCIQCWLNFVLDLLVTAIGVVVIALAVLLPHMTSPGTIGLALNNVLGFNQALAILIDSWTQLETSLGAIARLRNMEQTVKSEHQEGEDSIPPETWPEQGAVELKNISASYGPSIPVLREISMSILPGQKVGICGRTGSGKSSLLLSLLRLLSIDSGTITIDGYDLQTLPRELLRSRLIAIPQEPCFLSESIRINADPSGKSSDEAIINACKTTQIWDAIEKRGGLDAHMNEKPLSQGEKQLFCLARAILRSGKILILDEATSNVDAETDRLMQRIIREKFQDYTIITVAHRLDTIMDSDMVAVLDKGRLVEYAPPLDLLNRPSMFAELASRSREATWDDKTTQSSE